MPIKILDSSPLLELGWRPKTSLREALRATYAWYLRERAPSAASTGVRFSS
jgi:GDP-L-fucose synthase